MQTWFPCESDCVLVYVSCVRVCLQSARSLSSGGVRRVLVGGNEGSPSPLTSFPCKRVFSGVCVCMLAISLIVYQW
jgi:hypothetical protein